jgi:hypothetical protein
VDHRVGLEAAKRERERGGGRQYVFLCWESSQDSPVVQFTDRARPAPGIRYAVESKDGATPNFCSGLGYGKQCTVVPTIYFQTKNLVTKSH